MAGGRAKDAHAEELTGGITPGTTTGSRPYRGYLAAIKYFCEMYAGWEFPISHCMIAAVSKRIDREHGTRPEKWSSGCPGYDVICRKSNECRQPW